MSRFPNFLYENEKSSILTGFFSIKELFSLRKINVKWRLSSESRLLESYLNLFADFNGFNSLIVILFYFQKNIQEIKSAKKIPDLQYLALFNLIYLSENLQAKLVEKIKKVSESHLNIWQLMASIAPLNLTTYHSWQKNEFQKENFVSLLELKERKTAFIKGFSELIPHSNSSHHSDFENLNYIVNSLIKMQAHSLLEFLLRLGIGRWYQCKVLFTDGNDRLQHPLITCMNHNNFQAFQSFLTHAAELMKIYHRFPCLSHQALVMNYAILTQRIQFVKEVAEKKPEIFDQLNDCQNNVAHSVVRASNCYRNYREIVYLLHKHRPGIFYVADTLGETPKKLLPEEFLTDPRFKSI